MRFAPRVLLPAGEAEITEEFRRIGVDPALAPGWAARAAWRMIRLSSVPKEDAERLGGEIRALGGKMAMAPASGPIDLLLLIAADDLHLLCRRLPEISHTLADLAGELSGLLRSLEAPPGFLAGRTCRLILDRPRIMGVLNVTPDSFSDGGRYASTAEAVRRGVEMAAEGADLIDIGGESTRPGALPVSPQEEIDRVVPVIEALRREMDLPLSVDTTKAAVARAAVLAGAEFINDISSSRFDPDMLSAAAESGAGLFLMHSRGRPAEMQRDTSYHDLMGEVLRALREGLAQAQDAGIPPEKLAVDPGIGFAKGLAGNLEILRRLGELAVLGRPILLGTSRKSFIGRLLGQPDPEGRLAGTLATVALGVSRGAHLFRVHDVRPAREAALVAWAVCSPDSARDPISPVVP